MKIESKRKLERDIRDILTYEINRILNRKNNMVIRKSLIEIKDEDVKNVLAGEDPVIVAERIVERCKPIKFNI